MMLPKSGLVVALTLATFAGPIQNTHAFNIDEAVEGYWYEAGLEARRGWGFQYLPMGPEEGLFFVAGFVYGEEGEPLWVTGQGMVQDGDFEVDLPLQLIAGGSFGPDEGDPQVIDDHVGTLNVEFLHCNSARFTFFDGEGLDFEQHFDPFLYLSGSAREKRCVYQREFWGCPEGTWPGSGPRSCRLEGSYGDDLLLSNEVTWQLDGVVYIGEHQAVGAPVPVDGPTLTIEAGTRIEGLGPNSALVISRGSKIRAAGQPHAPIVMTGPRTMSEGAAPGDWGGLVINGAATINGCPFEPCENEGEGGTGAYGGANDNDSSGVLRYLRVQYAGGVVEPGSDDDLPGISFLGVGRGTVVENVQVHRGHDDGVKFQGGTVNVRRLVVTHVDNDSLDFSEGYRGKLQDVLVSQAWGDVGASNHAIELENNDTPDALPRTRPTLANMTLVGRVGLTAIHVGEGSGGQFSNVYVYGWSECLDIDDPETFIAAGSPMDPTGALAFRNSMFVCQVDFVEEDGDPWGVGDFVRAFPGNHYQEDPILYGYFPGPSPFYLQGYALDPVVHDDFFQQVDWIGAFRKRDAAWIWNWTEFVFP